MPEKDKVKDKEEDKDGTMTDTNIEERESREEAFIDTVVDESGEWSVLDNDEGFDPYNSGAHRFPKKR